MLYSKFNKKYKAEAIMLALSFEFEMVSKGKPITNVLYAPSDAIAAGWFSHHTS